MTTTNQNISMYSGDSKLINVTVTMDGTLAGASITWSAGQDWVSIITKTVGSGITITGDKTFSIELEPTDTASIYGSYIHEAQVIDSLLNVSTILKGQLKINRDLIV